MLELARREPGDEHAAEVLRVAEEEWAGARRRHEEAMAEVEEVPPQRRMNLIFRYLP